MPDQHLAPSAPTPQGRHSWNEATAARRRPLGSRLLVLSVVSAAGPMDP